MPVNWDDEPYLVMYMGYSGDDYLSKEQIKPYTEADEAGYVQWAANYEALGVKRKKGKRRARYFIMPKSEAEKLPPTLSDWEIEARDIGLKNGAEYNEVYYTMKKYWDIDKVTEGTRKGFLITMAQLYDTYRDEVVDANGIPDSITKFVTAIMTNTESWAAFQAESEPLVAELKAERKKKKKARRRKRLNTLAIVIAVVALVIFAGPAIISAVTGTGAAAVPTTATTGITSALTAIGVPASAASAIAAIAPKLVKQGFKKKDVASAAANVAIPLATPPPPAPIPTKPPTAISPLTIVLIAGGGIVLTGLTILLIARRQ